MAPRSAGRSTLTRSTSTPLSGRCRGPVVGRRSSTSAATPTRVRRRSARPCRTPVSRRSHSSAATGSPAGPAADEASFLESGRPCGGGNRFRTPIVRARPGRLRPTLPRHLRHRARRVRGAAYACAQVIIESLREWPSSRSEPRTASRGRPRLGGRPDPSIRHGHWTLGFDKNGDSLQQFVTFYRVDPSAAGGKGDWVIAKQQDYGPAP